MKYDCLIKPPESRLLKSGRVVLQPGEDVGEHVTKNKEEVLLVLKGSMLLKKGSEEIALKAGEVHYISQDVVHNVVNGSDSILEYVYVVALFDQKPQ
ncbi:cupin domain-containing protein [Candidatus Woesearchaeota archaeon]|nr:cupin domain-containing protein [Candidatus Woesearchaeota archaeon]